MENLLQIMYGQNRTYSDLNVLQRIFKRPDQAQKFKQQVPHYEPEVVEIVKSVASYVYKTHGKSPRTLMRFAFREFGCRRTNWIYNTTISSLRKAICPLMC